MLIIKNMWYIKRAVIDFVSDLAKKYIWILDGWDQYGYIKVLQIQQKCSEGSRECELREHLQKFTKPVLPLLKLQSNYRPKWKTYLKKSYIHHTDIFSDSFTIGCYLYKELGKGVWMKNCIFLCCRVWPVMLLKMHWACIKKLWYPTAFLFLNLEKKKKNLSLWKSKTTIYLTFAMES